MFVESKMASPDKVIVRGCPRMNNFIKNINKQNKVENKKTKQITFPLVLKEEILKMVITSVLKTVNL